MHIFRSWTLVSLCFMFSASATSSKPATEFIRKHQQNVLSSLPFDNVQDFDDAARGLIGQLRPNKITTTNGSIVWDGGNYEFLNNSSPDTANPSLWRQSRLTGKDGLFEVVEGIYQVRGLDLSHTTFVEGPRSIVVIDTLTTTETGAAALELYRKYRSDKPIKAIIYTHSHADHFGGVRGFVSQESVDSGEVEIIAPSGFLESAASENIYAGTAMSRRSAYMFGAALQRGPTGQIGAGLGLTLPLGPAGLIAPTTLISTTGSKMEVDGIQMTFQMAPGTEAPSEMLIYLPQFKALCAAEDATHTMHNILTLRGSLVRNARDWAHYLTETIDLFGDGLEVVFASHHWPTWEQERVVKYLTCQRDMYAYLDAQTLRMINQGFTGSEIAENFTLPPALEQAWNTRGYYGSISHNVKAIYQRYMGWFDGVPANLWQHTPTERARRYVDAIGGLEPLAEKARSAFAQGDYRWAAELFNHAVFAYPRNQTVRDMLADTYEQLGYGSENGPWRNFYISGATELRSGNFGTPTSFASPDIMSQLTPEMVFDSLSVLIKGPEAWGEDIQIKVSLTDKSKDYYVWLSNGALVYSQKARKTKPDVTICCEAKVLPTMVISMLDVGKMKAAGMKIAGNGAKLEQLAGVLEAGDGDFNIVTP
ncbi:hypothetical protein LMH87_001290 [Akanthomyces muscarius]|uniref:Metallo-beta-lactamase domain-containing protein n=1 Tax=Akanthomyces muscarius TaxID=2231603 RepID=A0A9W8QHY9_AKAMU|nr:hypothetical protein LMH87_001290 [Akanthomyces muscarius]KAJ4156076.1 hypothetical protein LMH87_001290 [Akanthomyces muscarius]